MNSEEGVSLVKYAVGALLLCLLLGAVFFLWNILYIPANKSSEDIEASARSSTRQRLMSLQDDSNAADLGSTTMTPEEVIEAHPLVTQVTHTIGELSSDDLLFVFVCENKNTVTSKGWMFTYKNITYNNTSVLPCAPSNTVNDTDVPTQLAVKHLLQYSDKRCHVTVADVDYSGLTYTGIIVEVLT